jgi:hypothetical protein
MNELRHFRDFGGGASVRQGEPNAPMPDAMLATLPERDDYAKEIRE